MDYSIEALIAEGTGLKTRDEMRYTSSSESAYDGYFDAVQAELTRSFENLEFLDTYSRVNEANDASKLRMMKRLKRVYGTTIDDPIKASSVESFIDRNIRSIEEDKKTDDSEKKADNSAQNTDGDTKKTDGSTKEPGKVKAFFQRIIQALKTMLKGLKDFFKGLWEKIRKIFSKKKKEDCEVKTPEEIIESFNPDYKPIDRDKMSTNFNRGSVRARNTIFDTTGFSIANAKKFFDSKIDTMFRSFVKNPIAADVAGMRDAGEKKYKSDYAIAYEIANKKSDIVERRRLIASKMFNINKYFRSTDKGDIDRWYKANSIDKLFNVIDGLKYLEPPSKRFLANIDHAIGKLEAHIKNESDIGNKDVLQKNAEFLRTVSYAGNEILSTVAFLIKEVNSVLKPKRKSEKTGKSALYKAEKRAIMQKNSETA